MAPLSPEQWQILSPYLDLALTLSKEECGIWLQSLRAGNPEIADMLRGLLDEHLAANQEGYLEKGPALPLDVGAPGEDIDAYRLISVIGRGGMGTVWLAERSDGRFERKAAVKFLNFALAGRGLEQRFKREGAILGRLSHVNIAKLLDAGVTATGQPYLVIEHVEGEPIDRYCDQNRLSIDQRIKVFLDVLSAVAHAHANLVIHRDIKPSNVLVSKGGQVKLLDFGIAKLLEGEGQAAAATMLTHEAGAPLTPEYAAPEQITGSPVTTATDVYALGVLFYLLLTGLHPAGQNQHSAADLLKAILELEPKPPSDIVTPSTARTFTSASNRNTTPDRLSRRLRGELDTIVSKALKKHPQERYASVSALAEDLERYLSHEPIHARPDTFVYRAAKFVRRHRMAVSLAMGVVLAIVAGLIGTLVQARTARLQRDAAIRERDRANRITDFMISTFKVPDPAQSSANDLTAREILDRASKQIDTEMAKDPEAQARMMSVMGEVYDSLGLFSQAQTLFARALDLQRRVLGPDDPQTLKSLSRLTVVLTEEGSYPEAERLQREAFVTQTRVLGPEHPDTISSMARLATILNLLGQSAESVKMKREAFALSRRVSGAEDPETLKMANSFAAVLWQQGDDQLYGEAEKVQRDAIDIEKRVLGPEHPDTLNGMTNLGVIMRRMGHYAEAEKIYRETLGIQSRVLGPEHPDTLVLRDSLGIAIAKQKRYQEAEGLYAETLAVIRRVYGPNHPTTAGSIYNIACLEAVQGHHDKALSLLSEALDHGLNANIATGIESDEDLQSLHGNPRFAALVARAKRNVVEQ
jgi:serine/threonine protein kinase/Tfp pilus assembly protein PilF